jgi:hypothetical protein
MLTALIFAARAVFLLMYDLATALAGHTLSSRSNFA